MATLPRRSSPRNGSGLASPFSASPRKLQEVTLPDGNDLTASSGISMKQYEEQLNGLRKENFNLKLRIYFLEERLLVGTPTDIQALHEENVKLKVELEELRRQLTDKQQLLAAAAQAIDVLENQGSVTTDSDCDSLSNDNASLKGRYKQLRNGVTKVDDSKQNGDALNQTHLASTATNVSDTTAIELQNKLTEMCDENKKALKMVCKCLKEIQAKDKQIKLLTKENEDLLCKLSESIDCGEYETVLRDKDDQIKELTQRLQSIAVAEKKDDGNGNLQELLTKRLQNLAFFLDKLLAHKCVLDEDKKRLAESLLEQSLALGTDLVLDESLAPGDLTALTDEDFDVSTALRLQDLTLMLGHHRLDHLPTDSECWSEPDRDVSSARIGLAQRNARQSIANKSLKPRRSKASSDLEIEKVNLLQEKEELEVVLRAERDRIAQLELDYGNVSDELKMVRGKLEEAVNDLVAVRADLRAKEESLSLHKTERERLLVEVGESRERIRENDLRLNEARVALSEADRTIAQLRDDRLQYEEIVAERERELRVEAERAALAAGGAALQRALHMPRLILNNEGEVEDAGGDGGGDASRPTSPDQGIDSDRLSSLDADVNEPRSMDEENAELRDKLQRCRAALADALKQLQESNSRKLAVKRAICRQLHRTHGVLRQARDQLQ